MVHSFSSLTRSRFYTLLLLGLVGKTLSLRGTTDGDANDVFAAAKGGNLDALTDLIEADRKLLNVQDESGWTPLHIATKEGHAPAVKYLLDTGANITVATTDDLGLPPLMVGLKYLEPDHEVVSLLKDAVTEYVKTIPHQTQAHATAASGNTSRLKELLENDGDLVERKDENGWTPLHEAVNAGQMDCVKILLEYGSNINLETAHGWTPVLLAKKNRNHDIVDYLKEHEMDARTRKVTKRRNKKNIKVVTLQHAAANGDLNAVRNLVESNKAMLDELDEHNWTALHEAAHNGHEDIVKYLVNAGADVNIHTHGGWSAILLAGNRHVKHSTDKDKAKHMSILEFLLKNNPLIRRQESPYSEADKDVVMMAHQAAQRNDVLLLRELIKKNKAAAHALDEHGWAPVHEAARAGRLEVLEVLVAEGIDINLRSNFERGGSAVYLAQTFNGENHPTVEYLKAVGGEFLEPDADEL
uniref:Uncharacterized protein n=1 Tax=Corethron hystrix TaxID=216773 RepID=A0A6U5I3U4_9STRA|mmetsp:Transcript_32131/g.73918  ORF Transcript_32131/g.73918 Transcript_32131/m.73918 type:complete len:470 (+) Transcript_32131:85-1494(+)|eukprot:CAMPEP_0113317716 /NCGR_PEP_ID=MMETSP0010_2-20120614/12511_1 /TAXON_ID=216773 ORGANISM="Corethron hystrix, Strain 308" /NCGR_SAMPLE_ID=MMETSP0010_2 /ASSEMBLY_ACC=CAM_ASM_000155 /LENGTH=469 /DNA_ID=CAMNT_0000174749 /DNA_START=6 /DNA_END=1415 /DNA_ORIENTATION=- /assembly_acc=CAM_ASM_000155